MFPLRILLLSQFAQFGKTLALEGNNQMRKVHEHIGVGACRRTPGGSPGGNAPGDPGF